MEVQPKPPLSMAVIGSGLAGLTLANLASSSGRYEVTLYEKEPRLGMEAHSLVADIGMDGNPFDLWVDTPLRGILDTFYPHLVRMYRFFGIELVASEIGFSFSQAALGSELVTPYFSYAKCKVAKGFQLKLLSLPPFPESVSRVVHWVSDVYQRMRIALEWGRLMTTAVYLRRSGGLAKLDETLAHYLHRNHYSEGLAEGLVMPLFSVLCSCSLVSVREYPARVALDMLSGIATGNSLATRGGVGPLCAKLADAIDTVHLDCPVTKVLPLATESLQDAHLPDTADRSKPWTLVEDANGRRLFNYVVFATQANHACQHLQNPTQDHDLSRLKQVLGTFQYETTQVATHFDASLLPLHRENWRANNLFVPSKGDGMVMDTMHLNSHHPHLPRAPVRDVFQTYSPFKEPSGGLLLAQTTLQRVLVTSASSLAIDELDRLQGTAGLYFVGSYTYPGLPLLEGCVANSERLARSLGMPIPWAKFGTHQPAELPIPKLLKGSLNEAYFSLPALVPNQRLLGTRAKAKAAGFLICVLMMLCLSTLTTVLLLVAGGTMLFLASYSLA